MHCLLLQTIDPKCYLRCYLEAWRKTPFVCVPIGVKTETDTQRSDSDYEALRLQQWSCLGSSLCLSESRCSKHSRHPLIAAMKRSLTQHKGTGQHTSTVWTGEGEKQKPDNDIRGQMIPRWTGFPIPIEWKLHLKQLKIQNFKCKKKRNREAVTSNGISTKYPHVISGNQVRWTFIS